MIDTIRTERLILRPWRDSDLDAFAQMGADSEVMEFLLPVSDRQASDDIAARIRAHHDIYGFGFWAMELAGDAPFIGFTGLWTVSYKAHFTPAVEIGWRLARRYWGQGYVTEAAEAALACGFRNLQLLEIVATTVPQNRRSRAVMQRIGMRYNAADDFQHPKIAEADRLKSTVLYRISREEWLARNTTRENADSGIVIRHATIADAPEMTRFGEALKAENLDTVSRQAPQTLEEIQASLKENEALERAFYLLALHDGEVIGNVSVRAGKWDEDKHVGALGISVAKEWRCKRVGQALMTRAIAETKRWNGFCRLELRVAPWNVVAVRLYERMGFQHEGRRSKGTAVRGMPEDDLLMALVW
ncbi:MAG TPA: GNAT family N-acetyltransferase [Rhizomicrobium sp.]